MMAKITRKKAFICCILLFVNKAVAAIFPQDVTHFVANEKQITFNKNLQPNIVKDLEDLEHTYKELADEVLVDWGLTIPGDLNGSPCFDGDECMDYDVAKIVVHYDEECEHVQWTNVNLPELKDCINILDGHWYGGGEQFTQPWPIEKNPRIETPYVPSDMLQNSSWYGGVTERFWISSLGIAVRVNDTIPLFLSLPDDDGNGVADQLCFSSRYEPPYVGEVDSFPILSYSLCYAEDVRQVYERTFKKYFSLPTSIVDERMLTLPVWSTWAEYHMDINEEKVMNLANNIIAYGFNNSQIEIDDNWESCYGDAKFNISRFPDPAQMVESLHDMGFRVTLWIHPFINDDCDSFATASDNGYLIKNSTNQTQLTHWWQGKSSGLIDFTNPLAVEWWIQRLMDLQNETGIDNFKFDAGETNWIPEIYTLNLDKKLWPNGFTTAYVDAVSDFGDLLEVRVGHVSQKNGVFVRMLDKSSIWSYENGLKTMVPSLLHSELLGYPFCLPDMVGGNAYIANPSSELFIRWAQSNVFMPSIQFSILPWSFGSESELVVAKSKEVTELHAQFAPLIIELAKNSTQFLSPIVRPIWWLCPQIEECLLVDQEFLLGDDILVTPVVDKGATTLSVYFPPGFWKQADTGDQYLGPRSAVISGITIDSIIYFTRV